MRIPRTPPELESVFSRHKEFEKHIRDPKFIEYTRRCEAKYWPWNKVRMVAPSAGVDAEFAWVLVKMGRIQRYRWLPLKGHNNEYLRFNVPDNVQHELMLVDQQTAGRLLADDESPLSPSQRERFIIGALREEAIASSMLEGAATTRRDANRLLKTGRKPKTRGELMVVNNYHAIDFIRENRKTPLSKEFLIELQTILTKNTLNDKSSVGRLRREEDDITVVDFRDNETVHVPPPASELGERLDSLCSFANQSTGSLEFIHPMIRACVLHFQIGFDHPFCDGNGRTARALFYWSMLRNDYWLFEYLPISRLIYSGPGKYIRAFLDCETDDFDVTYFLNYKARIIRRARRELRNYILDRQEQFAEARRIFSRDRRLNHRQRETVLQGARNPDRIFTIAWHQSRFQVSYATARSDLLNLSKWGYLKVVEEGNRYDFYPSDKLRSL